MRIYPSNFIANDEKTTLIILPVVSAISVSLATPIAQAEVSKTHDELSGKTTISVTPDWKNWNGSPTLYLNYSFQDKTPTQEPKMLFFSVIAPISKYAECAKGVTGVIADSERIPTADERLPQFARLGLPNVEPLGRNNPRMRQYISLFARYQLEDFRKIANADRVVYQLCGKSSQVFELSEQERQDLRDYLEAITP
jgi:hypothetical protein